MAVTKIKPIRGSPADCLEYTMKNKGMGTEYEFEGVTDGIVYAMSDKHDGVYEYHTLTSYHNCAPGAELKTFMNDTADGYGSHYRGIRTKDGRVVVAYHLIQSFEGHEADPVTANEIGLRLAKERFGNFACVVSTHTNTKNIHNHIVICAWDKDGYKYNDCTATYNEIRRASDRLCEEYGLSVLEKTRASVLQPYYDRDGVRRKVEVTDRKIRNWKHCAEGKAAISSASDYRHSDAYKTLAVKNRTNRLSIKEDIYKLLPHVSSYEELLDRLRDDMGYEIKDRKADGGWRVHITFQAPGQLKGTRDCKIGDGEFYTRENLTAHIAELVAARGSGEHVSGNEEILRTATVTVPVINGVVRVNSLKMEILRDTVDARSSLESINRGAWAPPDREQLIEQIKGNLQALSFIESRNLHSYEQINGLYRAAYSTYNKVAGEIVYLEKEVSRLEEAMSIKEKLDSLETKLSGETASRKDLYSVEILINTYRKQHEKNGMNVTDDIGKVQHDIALAMERMRFLKPQIEKCREEIAGYEQCVRTLDRIDRKRGARNEHAMDEYYKIRSQGRYAEKSHTEPPQRERARGYER